LKCFVVVFALWLSMSTSCLASPSIKEQEVSLEEDARFLHSMWVTGNKRSMPSDAQGSGTGYGIGCRVGKGGYWGVELSMTDANEMPKGMQKAERSFPLTPGGTPTGETISTDWIVSMDVNIYIPLLDRKLVLYGGPSYNIGEPGDIYVAANSAQGVAAGERYAAIDKGTMAKWGGQGGIMVKTPIGGYPFMLGAGYHSERGVIVQLGLMGY